MKENRSFAWTVCTLAVPVALQSMLQSSFSVVDQIMIGQLGSVSVAGVGLAGKFSSLFSVLVAAIGAIAGIMISQYLGQNNRREVRRSFWLNLFLAAGLAGIFTAACLAFPETLMGLYTTDPETIRSAAAYLAIIAGTFLPMAGATMLSTLLRCMEKASLPLYASFLSACLNTVGNYVLIFGKCGFPALGAEGAAISTLLSQLANFLLILLLTLKHGGLLAKSPGSEPPMPKFNWSQYAAMLLPLLICEGVWSLGENVYAGIYGHLGTESTAAMTLINPVQGLMIGALSGLSQAASVIVGKELGKGEYDRAYTSSKKLLLWGGCGAAVLSVVIVLLRGKYVLIYNVEESVRDLTRQILLAYAVIAPVKVMNMILGGGILRSGGKTKYGMVIDTVGTWGFGVPLGLLCAFVLELSIPWVYFILSLEECVRFLISIVVFRKKQWMQMLRTG